MSSKKKKAAQQAAAATTPSSELAESMALLRYGAQLYDGFTAQCASDADQCSLRLQRYADYLEHFGFSLEREQQPKRSKPSKLSKPSLKHSSDDTGLSSDAGCTGRSHGAPRASGCLWGAAVECAEWTMPEAERAAADSVYERLAAESAELLGGHTSTTPTAGGAAAAAKKAAPPIDIAVVTANLTKDFMQTTWRQSQYQCDLKKTRVVFRWLCNHLTLIRLRDLPVVSAGSTAVESGGVGAKGRSPSAGRSRSAGSGSSGRGGSASNRKKQGKGAVPAVTVDENVAPPQPPDPVQLALETRACTPAVAARILQRMLERCQVRCEVVEGLMKGYAPTEVVPWNWNCVTIGGRRYLVDVAAAVFHGSFREHGSGEGGGHPLNERGAEAGPAAASAVASTSPSKRKDGKRGAKGAAAAAAEADAAAKDAKAAAFPLPSLSLTQGPRWAATTPVNAADAARLLMEFSFFADPTEFIYTHLPFDESATLLATPPTRAVWETAPRLAEGFFAFPVRLRSHPRSCLTSVRTAPFYITVVNDHPNTTELCAVVYPCTLEDLPQRLGNEDADGGCGTSVAPLGPQWVWHQRCEATGEETFTAMVPEGGYYCLVIGARTIRVDPYSCQLTAPGNGFTPIVRYQVKVNFTPLPTPLLPRQHFSPSVVRLISPVSQQVRVGTRTFSVMPTCSNVLRVAIVATDASLASDNSGGVLKAQTQSGSGKPTAAALPVSADQEQQQQQGGEALCVQPRRRLVCFLKFSPLDAVYEGEGDVRVGESIEVWICYSAPDHNGLTLREKTAVEEAERAAKAPPPPPTDPPPPPPVGKSTGSKAASRKAAEVPAGPTPEEVERERLSRRVSAGEVFMPAFSHLEVRKIPSAEAALVIQPQLSVAEERAATLRRLTGVTDRLFERAGQLTSYKTTTVGTFFEKKRHTPALAS